MLQISLSSSRKEGLGGGCLGELKEVSPESGGNLLVPQKTCKCIGVELILGCFDDNMSY